MPSENWIEFFLRGWGLVFTLYAIVQALAIWQSRGRGRVVVAIPLPLMFLVLISTFSAYREGSNLWPIMLILSSPIATVFILVVSAVQHYRKPRGPGSN